MDTTDNINQENEPSVDKTLETTNNINEESVSDSTVSADENAEPEAKTVIKNLKHEKRRKLVVIGAITVFLGWFTFIPFSWIPAAITPWLSMVLTVAGLVLSCIGVRIPAGARRNLAITSIIASSVLILVFIVFAVIFYILLG